MTVQDDVVADPATTPADTATERVLARRALPGWFVPISLVLALGLSAGTVLVTRSSVESDVRARGAAALEAAGISGVTLVAEGRDVTAQVPTGRNPDRVSEVLSEVSAIGGVEIEQVYASKKEAEACENLQRKIDRATNEQQIPFTGRSTRPTAAGERMIAEVGDLLTACRPAEVVVGGHSDTLTQDGPVVSLERARYLARQLERAGVAAGRIEVRGYGDQFPISDNPRERALNERGSVAVKEG